MKRKTRSLRQGPAVLEREFEKLLRRAVRVLAPVPARRLRKVSRRRAAAAD